MLELWQAQLWAALPVMQIAPVINTPQTFVAIVAGLLMAIAFQLLLTNLGIAIGVTALGLRWVKKADAEDAEAVTKPAKGNAVGTIGLAAGLGILFTINVVLFAACFLAGKLSLATSPFVGGIIGVVIWAAYFLLLLWLSSSAVTSIVGLILGSATAGLRSLVSAISAVLNPKDDSPYMTETAAMNAIREEVRSALKSDDMQDALKTYVSSLPAPQLDLSQIGGGLESMLKSPEVLALAGTGLLGKINRQTFVDLLRDRHDLSSQAAHQVVDHLETVWQQAMPRSNSTGELLNLFKSAKPEDLHQILTRSNSGGLLETIWQNVDFSRIRSVLMSRVDLSDLDIEQIWEQLRSLSQSSVSQSSESEAESSEAQPAQPKAFNSIAADLETFLLEAYPWQLQSDLIPATLRDILYDPEADPEQVRKQVAALDVNAIADILTQRHDLSEEQIDQLVQQFQTVQQDVIETTQTAAQKLELDGWRLQLEAAWQSDRMQDGVRSLLSAHPTEQVDRATLTKLLADRPDAPVDEWIDRLEAEIIARQASADAIGSELWQKLKPYFRYTKVQQLTPANVQRKLETTLTEIEPQLEELPPPKFDWDKLESVLKRRKSMSDEQLEQILSQAQQIWTDFTAADRRAARSHQAQIDRFIQTMRDYLMQPKADSTLR